MNENFVGKANEQIIRSETQNNETKVALRYYKLNTVVFLMREKWPAKCRKNLCH